MESLCKFCDLTKNRLVSYRLVLVLIFRLFQFPAVYTQSIVLVISPLIALMEDQVSDLTNLNIPACLVGSTQPDTNIVERICDGEFQLVYSSPEFLQLDIGREMLSGLAGKLTLVAIDEARKYKDPSTNCFPKPIVGNYQ